MMGRSFLGAAMLIVAPKVGGLTTSLSPDYPTESHVTLSETKLPLSRRGEKGQQDGINYLDIPLTATDPDIIGFGNVSGWYGPGNWAAWIILMVASWMRIFRKEEEKSEKEEEEEEEGEGERGRKKKGEEWDPNTFAFLLATNLSSVDLFRQVRQVARTDAAGEDYNFLLASYGAALMVVYWGTFTTTMQYATCFIIIYNEPSAKLKQRLKRRMMTITMGTLLPTIAITASIIQVLKMGTRLTNNIPTMYWSRMTDEDHEFLLLWTTSHVIMSFAGDVLAQFNALFKFWFPAVRRLRRHVRRFVPDYLVAGSVVFPYMIAMLPLLILRSVALISLFLSIFLALCVVFPFPMVFGTSFTCLFVFLTASTVATMSLDAGKSCFMPCTSYSITDEDQLYALIAGLASFAVFEVAPILTKQFKSRQEEVKVWQKRVQTTFRRAFERNRRPSITLPGDFELRRRPTAGLGV
jgi:hypothetical protein